ncbi:EcsC family protein [Turicibacter sp.]|uniref:EcsC family protein n=1 Tax=Turicibacter sp. TaxID=2049042 RepID=UPI001B3DC885|nr:EcsC family protein [Turicibacter sp.]MBP3903312.1 EcsC family protein [Turicibacter sp.]
MNNKITEDKMLQVLDTCYEKAIQGLPGFETAQELGDKYLEKYQDVEKAIDKFIALQEAKCMTSGFITGLGGVLTLPVAIPANVASVLYVQIRMIAAIAHMRGYDVLDDQVKTFIYVALTGNSAGEILKQSGIQIGVKMGTSLVKKIPGKVLTKINQKVGFRLLTKMGKTGAINLIKLVPITGGIVGGGFDLISTATIAKTAKKIFV